MSFGGGDAFDASETGTSCFLSIYFTIFHFFSPFTINLYFFTFLSSSVSTIAVSFAVTFFSFVLSILTCFDRVLGLFSLSQLRNHRILLLCSHQTSCHSHLHHLFQLVQPLFHFYCERFSVYCVPLCLDLYLSFCTLCKFALTKQFTVSNKLNLIEMVRNDQSKQKEEWKRREQGSSCVFFKTFQLSF